MLRGYLSLHQAGDNLTLKWTPNQLINGTLGDCDLEKRYRTIHRSCKPAQSSRFRPRVSHACVLLQQYLLGLCADGSSAADRLYPLSSAP